MSGESALRFSGRFIVRITTWPSRSTVQWSVVIGRISGIGSPVQAGFGRDRT